MVCVACAACPAQAPAGSTAEQAPPERAAAAAGVLEGTIVLEGEAPAAPPPTSLPESVWRQCGRSLAARPLVTSPGRGIGGVVVSIEVKGSAGLEGPPPSIDQRGCEYLPGVLAARAGTTLEIHNSDPLIHTVRAGAGEKTLFNVGMPLEGMVTRKGLPTSAAVIELQCDVHPWMHAWIKTFEHPYFTQTDATGHYRLEGVPSGKQKVIFWHPRLQQQEREVTIGSGKAVTLDAHLAVR